jgi:hypothetical protein
MRGPAGHPLPGRHGAKQPQITLRLRSGSDLGEEECGDKPAKRLTRGGKIPILYSTHVFINRAGNKSVAV